MITIFYGNPQDHPRSYVMERPRDLGEALARLAGPCPRGFTPADIGIQFGAYTGPAYGIEALRERIERASLGGTAAGRHRWQEAMHRLVDALEARRRAD